MSKARGGIRGAIILTVVAVLLVSLTILAAFNSLYFHKFLVNTQDTRLLAVALDARDALGRAVALGLPLGQFDGRHQVIEAARAGDGGVVGAALFEARGGGFVNIDAGTPLPEDWATAMRRSPAAEWWSVRDAQGFGVLVPVTNSFDTRVGVLALLQSSAVLDAPARSFNETLIGMTLLVAGPAALILAALVFVLVRPTVARLPVWSAHASALQAAAEAGAPLPDPPPPAATAGGRLIDALVAEPMGLLRADIRDGRT
ncbi:MAG: hypothetical protein WCZ23_12075 [Rhodospirillaceae bacterium]